MTNPKSATPTEADKETGRTAPAQTGEDNGRIKQAQNNPEPNLPRGSQPESPRAGSSRR